MTDLPCLADFLCRTQVKFDGACTLFGEDKDESREAPTVKEVEELYTRALDAYRHVRLNVPRGQQAATLSRIKHFDLYGKASCRYICQIAFNRFPKELRDLIYENILAEEPRNIPATPLCEPVHADLRAHYWRTEYVGMPMLTELMESWYRTVRFHIGMDVGFLERFLFARVSYLDQPRYQLISEISFKLDQRDFTAKSTQLEGNVRALSPRKRLLERLRFLFQLKKGASIHIYANRPRAWNDIPEESLSTEVYQNLLRDITTPIFPTLRSFKDSGYLVATAVEENVPFRWPQVHQLYNLEVDRGVAMDDMHFFPEGDVDMIWRQVPYLFARITRANYVFAGDERRQESRTMNLKVF